MVFAPTIPNPPIDHAGTLDPVRSIAMPGRGEYRISICRWVVNVEETQAIAVPYEKGGGLGGSQWRPRFTADRALA